MGHPAAPPPGADPGPAGVQAPHEASAWSRLGEGCLGGLFELLGLGVLCLMGVGAAYLLVWSAALTQDEPVMGVPAAVAGLSLLVYGGMWTVRVRPGLYLEHLHGDGDEAVRRSGLVGTGWPRRIRLLAMGSVQVALAAAAGYAIFRLEFD